MTSTMALRCFHLLAVVTLPSVRADLGVQDGAYTEPGEELPDTISLLQVSLEHAPANQVGQLSTSHKEMPEDSEEKKLENDWADLLTRSWAYGEKHFPNTNDNFAQALSQQMPSLEALAKDPNAAQAAANAFSKELAKSPQAAKALSKEMPSLEALATAPQAPASALSPHATAGVSPETSSKTPFGWLMKPQGGWASSPSVKMADVPPPVLGDTDLYMYSADATNTATFLLILLVITCIIYKPGPAIGSGGCPTWVVLTLVVSYISWIFGFFMYNTSYFMTGVFMGKEIIMSRDFQTGHPAVFKESPHLIIVNLIQAKDCIGTYCATSQFAGWCYLLFSVGDPLLKLSLMVMGEVLRRRPDSVHVARQCIITCQVLSKWASPMYYFLLIVHCQFLLMDQPPGLSTRAVLDIGWVGFTLFCVTNVVSAVSIPLPEPPSRKPLYPLPKENSSNGLSDKSKDSLMIVVSLAAVLYYFLIVFGISYDLVSLNTESYAQFMKGFLDPRTEKAFHTSISIVGCMNVLLSRFFTSGQLIPLVAFFILASLVIAMALADMCLLTIAAFCIFKGNKEAFQYWMSKSRITRQCSAVDVLVVGVLLANLSKSLVIEFGVYFLLYAEVLRYVVIYLVMEPCAQCIEDSMMCSPGKGKGTMAKRSDALVYKREVGGPYQVGEDLGGPYL